MDKLQQQVDKRKIKVASTRIRHLIIKTFLLGSIVAIIIAATPFLFYLYEYVPDTKIWETTFCTYNSNYYESANVGIWVLMMKFVPLITFFNLVFYLSVIGGIMLFSANSNVFVSNHRCL